MEYVFTGFQQVDVFRVYGFQRVDEYSRKLVVVRTDLNLVRKYGIALQELPLLCRRLLEQREDSGKTRSFLMSEDDMRRYSDTRAALAEAAAERKRKAHKRFPPRTESVSAH